RPISMLPNGITFLDSYSAGQRAYPIHEIPPQGIVAVSESIQEHMNRIADALYARLWLTIITSNDTSERTAKEIVAREADKLLQLGPMITRLHNEFLKP